MSQDELEWVRVWRLIAVVVDGKDVPVGHSTVMQVTPAGYTVKVNGKVFQQGTSTTDLSKSPTETDVMVTQGPNAGMTLRQINRIDGSVLIACQGRPGAARPAEFVSEPGSGHSLSVWLQDEKAVQLSQQQGLIGRWAFLFWLPVLLVADDIWVYQKDLEPGVGYWGSLAVIGLVLAALQMIICLLLKLGWRAGLTYGVCISLAILVDGELTKAIEPTLGHSGAVLVALSTAIVAGITVWQIMSRLLKLRT